MGESLLFLGCIVAFAVLGFVFLRARTAFFGLTALTVFHVAAATLAAFVVAKVFNLEVDSVTPEHADVELYSILGLLAMAMGIYIGWRPIIVAGLLPREERSYIDAPSHINERVGWVTFVVGAVAESIVPFVWSIPTLGTAVNCLSAMARVGLLILLLAAIKTGRWKRFVSAVAVFAVLAVVGSLSSGFTFLRMNTLLPLIIIFFASSGFAVRYMLPAILAIPLFVSGISAWLATRDMIRGSSPIDDLPYLDQVATFFAAYVSNLSVPTAQSALDMILYRVDMSDILAAQVRHQPEFEPYAFGETVYSAFYTLIPRFIWPDKPVVAGGSEFYQRFTGLVRSGDDVTSIGVAYPFELYANGGPVVVVVGLAVIGFICARLELTLFRRPRNLATFWALALILGVLSEGGQRTDVVLPAAVAAGLAAFALGKFLEKAGFTQTILPPVQPAVTRKGRPAPAVWTLGRRRSARPEKRP
jgi:hypothetical protein